MENAGKMQNFDELEITNKKKTKNYFFGGNCCLQHKFFICLFFFLKLIFLWQKNGWKEFFIQGVPCTLPLFFNVFFISI